MTEYRFTKSYRNKNISIQLKTWMDIFFCFNKARYDIESVLAECLGLDCVTFEHGTSNPFSKGANSVDHVHIHIVPFERPIWQDIVSTISPLSIKDIDNYERLYQEWQSIHPDSYLLFQDTNQKIYYIPDASNMPSQLFRKCLAPHLAAPCWNWKNEAYIDNMMRTMALFKRNG